MEINTRMKNIIIILPFKFIYAARHPEIASSDTTPCHISNHMVLQRNSELTFWGWGIPGETISIAPEWMKGEIIKPKSIIRGNGQPVYLPAKPADLMRFVSAARQK